MVKYWQVIFMLKLVPILSRKAQAVVLTKNVAASCLGEEVIFTCTLPENVYSLTWSLLITRNPDIPVLRHSFFYGDYVVDSERITHWQRDSAGFYAELELVSIEPVLVSTLATNLTGITIDAQVMCAQSSSGNGAQNDRITLASKFLCPVLCNL